MQQIWETMLCISYNYLYRTTV